MCVCGHAWAGHQYGPRCIGNRNLCTRLAFREKARGEQPKPCTCGPDEACGDPCVREPLCPYACSEGHTYSGSCLLRAYGPGGPEEPPLTPEEEEEAAEDACSCGNAGDAFSPTGHRMGCLKALPPESGPEYEKCVCGHIVPEHEPNHGELCMVKGCECAGYRTKPDFEIPPQPDRRPPYAVSYSVQGHLFEVALPGDASVRAVDGALVIQHHLGPVAGIVQVLPVINEEK